MNWFINLIPAKGKYDNINLGSSNHETQKNMANWSGNRTRHRATESRICEKNREEKMLSISIPKKLTDKNTLPF